MNCIETYFEMIMEMHEPYEERNAFSQLDHLIQYSIGIENCLEILKENYCELYDVPSKYKVYIAALTEYIFHRCNQVPPEWVYDKKYYLKEPDFSEGIKTLCKRSGTNTLKNFAIENAIPEFQKRNYMITDVLSAV